MWEKKKKIFYNKNKDNIISNVKEYYFSMKMYFNRRKKFKQIEENLKKGNKIWISMNI